ncbi:hypothetical protein BD779DRAFT_946998 [Infundibulicybe gibba]|nr:hypothetical protein BD779DRAFT_946998 [Infundibulicybe gibba]
MREPVRPGMLCSTYTVDVLERQTYIFDNTMFPSQPIAPTAMQVLPTYYRWEDVSSAGLEMVMDGDEQEGVRVGPQPELIVFEPRGLENDGSEYSTCILTNGMPEDYMPFLRVSAKEVCGNVYNQPIFLTTVRDHGMHASRLDEDDYTRSQLQALVQGLDRGGGAGRPGPARTRRDEARDGAAPICSPEWDVRGNAGWLG